MQEAPSSKRLSTEDALRLVFSADFRVRFEHGLTPRERQLWDQFGLNPPEEQDKRRVVSLFDEFVIQQARVLGPRIFHVEAVVLRLAQWWDGEENGPDLLRCLGEALELGARVIRGQACLPIDDPAWYPFKREAVPELRLLRNQLRNRIASAKRFPSPPKITGLIGDLIRAATLSFPRLAENLTSLVRFLEMYPALASDFAAGDATPTRLYDEWVAWSTNRDAESMRRRVSMLGSRKQTR